MLHSIASPRGFFSLLLVLASQASVAEVKFFSGSNIYNKDNKSYNISYTFSARTKFCFVLKPTPEIKRSLRTTLSREASGLTIIKRNFDGENASVQATLAGNSRVYCLCTDDCEITIENIGKSIVSKGKTLVIENGTTSVQ